MPMSLKVAKPACKEPADAVARELHSDILLYNGPLNRDSCIELMELCKNRKRRPGLLFLLTSEGGDPDAAYRIGRGLQYAYEHVACLVSGYCKSAGTLVAIGAHELVMTNDGELGPIDIQMSKKDELWEFQSGLTVISALTALHEKAYLAFEHFLLETIRRGQGSISLKTAADIAQKLTTGLFAPIYGHLDPVHLGEGTRAMSIGNEYGRRLNHYSRNLKSGSLDKLVSTYPDHGFVIDRTEAETLFFRVRKPSDLEQNIVDALEEFGVYPISKTPHIEFLDDEERTNNAATGQGTAEAAEATGPEPGPGPIATLTGGNPPQAA